MTDKPKTYRLFAFDYSLENVAFASKFRFFRVTAQYILVYAQRKRINPPDGKAVEIKEDEISRLSKKDESWLFECMVVLFADIANKPNGDGMKRLSDMVEQLEKELEEVSALESE